MKFPNITRKLTALSVGAASIASALVLSISNAAAANVQMEGYIYAKNVTQGTAYAHAGTSAKAGDTVSFEVYYHNQEDPDSGLNANNVRIKVALPTDSATSHTVSATIKADNSNQVNDNTVVTSTAATQLQFVPGSVTWRHNTGSNASPQWVTQSIGDDVVTNANGAIVEQTEKPCNNFSATVAFQAKVIGQQTPPPAQPTYACTLLDVKAEEDRTAKITAFNTSATNGAVFKTAVVDWGDHSQNLTSSNLVGQTHQYTKDGRYTITATAHFTVNDKDKTATSEACSKTVTFKSKTPPTVTPPTNTTNTTNKSVTNTTVSNNTTNVSGGQGGGTPGAAAPTTLVNTGPGQMAAIFLGATAAGTCAYRWFLTRRFQN